MGAFEEKLREILAESCAGELLDITTEEILEAHCGVYALYTMNQLMGAQEDASEVAKARSADKFQFFQGKIKAYQELFVKVAFDGLSVEDGTLSEEALAEAMEFWKTKVEDFILLVTNTGEENGRAE